MSASWVSEWWIFVFNLLYTFCLADSNLPASDQYSEYGSGSTMLLHRNAVYCTLLDTVSSNQKWKAKLVFFLNQEIFISTQCNFQQTEYTVPYTVCIIHNSLTLWKVCLVLPNVASSGMSTSYVAMLCFTRRFIVHFFLQQTVFSDQCQAGLE